MTSTDQFPVSRYPPYAVMRHLEAQGYTVIRVAHRRTKFPVPFHLIAWLDPRKLICIRVAEQTVNPESPEFLEEVAMLSEQVRRGIHPGELQFWIMTRDTLLSFRIFAGGSMMITEETDAIR